MIAEPNENRARGRTGKHVSTFVCAIIIAVPMLLVVISRLDATTAHAQLNKLTEDRWLPVNMLAEFVPLESLAGAPLAIAMTSDPAWEVTYA